jgi:DNA-directed RNA polymerase specialized sigma24 family protein
MSPNQIILEIYRSAHYRRLCNKIARADLADDLYQEFILALLTMPALEEVYEKEWFNYFCIRVITNLYRSKTSTFYKKYRHLDITTNKVPDNPVFTSEDPQTFPYDEERMLLCMNKELDKMDGYTRELFHAYLKLRSARMLSRKTNISQRSITTTIRAVKDQIRNSKDCMLCLQKE